MNRRTRKAAYQLAVFIIILTLLIYVNQPPSSTRTFAWSTVRYRTTARSLPAAHGVCPGLAKSKKPALVVSHVQSDGDTSWLTDSDLAKKYHLCIYDVDGSSPSSSSSVLRTPSNRAHEAMAYLTFLIDNYDAIPAPGAVFIHGNRWSWHNDAPDYDNAYLLAELNVERALEPAGYHNLRCDWSVSTCLPDMPPQGSMQMALQSKIDPWDARAASDAALPGALAAIFGRRDPAELVMLSRHEAVRAQCCAQFVVSKERIRSHSREEYVALRQWLLDGADAGTGAALNSGSGSRVVRGHGLAPKDDRVAGRIISYIWHILFLDVTGAAGRWGGSGGEGSAGMELDVLNRAACPSAQDCYCRLYGRCDLQCRSPGSCVGQYSIPPGYQVPGHGPKDEA
ncbi:DUF3431 domain-containing protein [Aspergillus mulundensis]|uniref:Uncharacterized protein n=1 Tax=Aspergillus mulundensis TaxID=1810919 RepID=A0A3D8R470_9EURO|nr:Uncharacterized protein DSM5745_08547 [Aspergillus mulundensis]RDW68787.1 Uncharacterized protein DSM5745_08547 [Aspergillus mulundensis]